MLNADRETTVSEGNSTTIDPSRIQLLNDKPPARGDYVFYWMQQSQRAEWNHAFEFAVSQANELRQPVLVGFGLTDGYPEANLRHYRFMLEGLRETQLALEKRGVPLRIEQGSPDEVAIALGRKASLIVCDRGYLRHQKLWRKNVAESARCRVVQVETDVVVPVESVSNKAEFAARTIRPKIQRLLPDYLTNLRRVRVLHPLRKHRPCGFAIDDLGEALDSLKIDCTVSSVQNLFRGGTKEATRRLRNFLRNKLDSYNENRNQPHTDDVTHLSPYLHFGQISPLYIALSCLSHAPQSEGVEKLLEELIVRRELACNFVHYTPNYDTYESVPDWARKTLTEHLRDPRPYTYSIDEFESARTHDPYWNAAMREMRYTGYMHNAMRMYWGKKILEWSANPRDAFAAALKLNNKYFLDGRDPNSYMNVCWLFGLHDRPWGGRSVFGTVRTMTASGLERKSDPRAYVAKVDELVRHAEQFQRSGGN